MASLTVMVPWLVWQGSSLPGIPSARDPRPHLALEAITHLEIVILNFLEKAGLQCHFFLNAKLQWPKNEAAVSCFTATFHSWFWPCCCYFAAWMLASPMTWILSKWRCMGARHWHTDAWILNSESILSLLGTLDLHGFTGVLKLSGIRPLTTLMWSEEGTLYDASRQWTRQRLLKCQCFFFHADSSLCKHFTY